MIIKRKLYSVGTAVNLGFNVMGVSGIASGIKDQKQAEEEHQAILKANEEKIKQLNNIAR